MFSQWPTSLHSNFTRTWLSTVNHSWHMVGLRKLRTLAARGEDCILLRSLVLTQYRSLTDGLTDMP